VKVRGREAAGIRLRGGTQPRRGTGQRRVNAERLPALAGELVAIGVQVIVTTSTAETRAAKNASAKIPIAFIEIKDPNDYDAALARAKKEGAGGMEPRGHAGWRHLEVAVERIGALLLGCEG
jgi:hypothetical protein